VDWVVLFFDDHAHEFDGAYGLETGECCCEFRVGGDCCFAFGLVPGHACYGLLSEGVEAFVVFYDEALVNFGWYFGCWVARDDCAVLREEKPVAGFLLDVGVA
jgi:hypothetical protein